MTLFKSMRRRAGVALAAAAVLIPSYAVAERSITFSLANKFDENYVAAGPENGLVTDSGEGVIFPRTYTYEETMRYLMPCELAGHYFYGSDIIESMEIGDPSGVSVLYANTVSGGSLRPYFVLSPIIGNDNLPASRLTFNLTHQEEGWNVSKIILQGINFDRYRYNGGKGATGIIKVNGHDYQYPTDRFIFSYSIDIPEEERPIRSIELVTDSKASVGVRTIAICLAETPEFIVDAPTLTRINYDPAGNYTIPMGKIGPLYNPSITGCTIFDNEGNKVDVDVSFGDDMMSTIRPGSNVNVLEEGVYRATYYVLDNFYSLNPLAEDGVQFSILPTVEGLTLNGQPIEGNYCLVPNYAIFPDENGNDVEHEWPNILLGGLKEGTEVYYKISHSDSPNDNENRSDDSSLNPDVPIQFTKEIKNVTTGVCRVETEGIPEGYRHVDNSTVDLRNGNTINFILARNGAVSDPIAVHYEEEDHLTGIQTVDFSASQPVRTLWYDIHGNELRSIDDVPNGSVLIKISCYPDGTIKNSKIIK